MEYKITNIVLEGNRFRVFIEVNGIEENNLFMPDITSTEIRQWAEERALFYQELKEKEEELKNELINL